MPRPRRVRRAPRVHGTSHPARVVRDRGASRVTHRPIGRLCLRAPGYEDCETGAGAIVPARTDLEAAMEMVDAIKRLGFKKWYERQLIESHVYLVTCFLCMILVAACVETLDLKAPNLQPLAMLGWIFAGGAVGLVSWNRYRGLMLRAERLGDRSTCASCQAYAKFEIVEAGGAAGEPLLASSPWLKVRCRKCGNQWTLE